jgi:hypothetical protein
MSKTKTQTKGPAYRIFCVTSDNGKSSWQEIGAAWKHKDGEGLNLQFKALPLPAGQMVLRVPKAKPVNAQPKG